MNDIMTPEDYQMLLSLGGQNAQDEQVIQQMLAQAEQLRAQGATPGMRDAGRVRMAAHPLEFLSSMANQGLARQKDKDIMAQRKTMGGRTDTQNQMVLSALLRGRQGMAPQQPPQMPPQGMQQPPQMMGPYSE